MGDESFTSENVGPHTVFTWEGNNPKTLDAVLEEMEVDLKKYVVDHWIANKWDGQLKGGKPVPMYQVKVWLIPIKLEPIELTVPQVHLSTPKAPKKKGKKAKIRRALFLTDLHIGFRRDIDTGELTPYHDREALDVVLQVASRFPFDEIIFGGDQLDLPEWTTKFNKGPEFYFTTKPSILELGWWIDRFRHVLPDAQLRVLEGNHEKRLPNTMDNHLIAAYGIPQGREVIRETFDLQRILGLSDEEWFDGYPNEAYWLTEKVKIVHGNKTSAIPGNVPAKILNTATHSIIYGHNHKREMACRTFSGHDGETILTAGSPGALCRIDYQVPGHAYGQQWQQGFGVINLIGDDLSNLELVPISSGHCFYEGYEFSSSDSIHDLASKFLLEAMNSG